MGISRVLVAFNIQDSLPAQRKQVPEVLTPPRTLIMASKPNYPQIRRLFFTPPSVHPTIVAAMLPDDYDNPRHTRPQVIARRRSLR